MIEWRACTTTYALASEESVRSCEGLGEGTRVNQQMRTGMNAVSQIGDRRGTLGRCREGKEEAVHSTRTSFFTVETHF